MIDKAFELAIKALTSEGLTDSENNYMHVIGKYEIVRYVYMEKMKHEGSGLTNFQFSPGDNFMETPIIDIVNGLLKVYEEIKNGDYEVLDFDDESWIDNPPHSGKEKTTL